MLDDIALFCTIVECGSLSAAARRLGLPAATVTRRLQHLEKALGCRLLHRTARQLKPTAEGLAYHERCNPLLQSLTQTAQSLHATLNEVQGLVRVLAPINMAHGLLLPVWASFLRRYPSIRLDLRLSNLREDLLASGADLAIRVGEQPDSSLSQRRLGEVATLLVAAPGYLHVAPSLGHPRDLSRHAMLVSDPMGEVVLQHTPTGERYALRPRLDETRLRVNDIALPLHMARQGLGVLHCPLSQCHADVQAGTLQRVLPDWQTPTRPVYAVWAQRALPARVRALLDELDAFAQREPLLGGLAGTVHDDEAL